MQKVVLMLLGLAVAGRLVAQPAAPAPHPTVPAALEVAGLHVLLTDDARRLVQQKADGLLRHQPSFQARVDLADAAFPIIDRVLKEEGVPLDFHYLALQESALQPDAESAHGAVGYWQLKRETATSLGLVVNDAVDERRHLAASTRAAARYLARNNASLRNWLSALLSYNTGLGGVKAYVLPTDADATQVTVTADTAPYVLMFLAQKVAFEPSCGLNPRPRLRLQEFPAVAGQTLAVQAETIYADPVALAAHNRWLLAPAVPADRPYTLLVPVTDAAQAAGLLAQQRLAARQELLALPTRSGRDGAEVRLNNLRALVALPGETAADLARRGGQRLGEFLRHNEMTAFDEAQAGRPYYLESKRDAAAVEYYVLLPGETVADVAQKHGVRQRAVLAKNRLAYNDELRAGRVLWLQHTRPREVAPEFRALPDGSGQGRRPGEAPTTATPTRPTATARANQDSEEGWGDATPALAPAPAPVTLRPVAAAEAEPTAPMPRPAAPPVPAPLADEPRVEAPEPAAPVASRPVPETRSAPVPEPAATAAAKAARVLPAVRPAAPRPAAVVPQPIAASMPLPAAGTHRVEPHETVYSIGRRYGIVPAALMVLNHLTPQASLAVGQVLVLQEPAPTAPIAKPAATTKPAPMPAQAARPAVAAAATVAPNKRHAPVLYVPRKAAATAASAPSVVTVGPAGAFAAAAPVAAKTVLQHTVAKGETLYSIARLYKVTVTDLKAWNAKTDDNANVGEVLRVQIVPK